MEEVRVLGNMDNTIDHTFESANRVYDKEMICPTIPTGCGGGHTPKIIEDREPRAYEDVAPTIRAKREGLKVVTENLIVAMRGRNPDNPKDRTSGVHTEQRLELNTSETTNTLTTVQKDNLVLERGCRYRIRKLTPRECFRLMGVSDCDADKMLAVNSNSQCYKQAGNSIVVDVMCAMFRKLF